MTLFVYSIVIIIIVQHVIIISIIIMHMLNVALTAIWRLPENDCHPLFCVEGVTITNQQGCNLHMTANGQVLTYPWQHR